MTFDDALKADSRLVSIDTMVTLQAMFIRPEDTFCGTCYWEHVLKPLVYDLLGWGRGDIPTSAEIPAQPFKVHTLSDFADWAAPDQAPATTEIETWLRTSEAYDLLTDRWLDILDKADPANGHGFKRG